MPSADTEPSEVEPQSTPVDEAREALVESLRVELGPDLLQTHVAPGVDVWARVANDAWSTACNFLKNAQNYGFFDFLSAVDWLPSPYGRSHEAEVDVHLGSAESPSESWDSTIVTGYGGGETRFQALARVYSLSSHMGINLKADIDESMQIETIVDHYPGAAWHERECYEMFGIEFVGHEKLRNIYLPTGFEGNPLRKDYPLLARLIKPWPGIVDVEPMPEVAAPSLKNPDAEGTQP